MRLAGAVSKSLQEPYELEPDGPRDLNLSSYSFDAQALKRLITLLLHRSRKA